jgi:hypothetical protein
MISTSDTLVSFWSYRRSLQWCKALPIHRRLATRPRPGAYAQLGRRGGEVRVGRRVSGLRDDLQAEHMRLGLRPGEHVAAESESWYEAGGAASASPQAASGNRTVR